MNGNSPDRTGEKRNADNNLRVLLFNEVRDWGGGEEYTLSLMKILHQRNVTVTLVTNRNSILFEKARKLDLPVIAVPMRNVVDIPSILALRKIIKQRGITVIHTNTMRDHVLAGFAARLAGVGKIIRTQHIHYPHYLSIPEKLAYQISSSIICVSRAIKADLEKNGVPLHKLIVAYGGIDVDRYLPHINDRSLRTHFGFSEDEIAIGVVSSLFKTKGHESFLNAAGILAKKEYKFKFIIAGRGPERENLERLARELGITEMVHFAGFRDDIPQFIAAMDMLVTPSIWEEPAGLNNMEIMLMGKPLIATSVGGIPEIVIDGETGLLIPRNAPDRMAEAVLRLISDRELAQRIARTGSERVKEHFTLDTMADKILQVYTSNSTPSYERSGIGA